MNLLIEQLDLAFLTIDRVGLRPSLINMSQSDLVQLKALAQEGSPYLRVTPEGLRYRDVPVILAPVSSSPVSSLECHGLDYPIPLVRDYRDPIETAPRDGTWFEAIGPTDIWRRSRFERRADSLGESEGPWSDENMRFTGATHWRPLPA